MIPIKSITENKTIRATVRGIIILIILWLLWTMGGTWLKPTIIKGLGGYTNSEYKETVDTLEIQRDTIYLKYSKLETLVENMQEPIIKYKYKYIDKSVVQKGKESSSTTKGKQSLDPPIMQEVDSVYAYSQVVGDSLIDGNIHTIINLSNCKIIEQKLIYKPKFPIIVKETITIEKTKETTLENKKTNIGFGGTATSRATIGVLGVYQTKELWQIQLGYNWVNKRIIDDKNKTEVSLSIIKLF